MTKSTHPQKVLLIILLFCGPLTFGNAYAQNAVAAKSLSTSFFVELAQKLVDRGEHQEAQNVLKRILQLDPGNSQVERLLKSAEDRLGTKIPQPPQESRPSDVAADIILIQKNVLGFERRNRDLEFAIRKALQDNLFLYQILSRNNQELLALRKKFFGYEEKGVASSTSDSDEKINLLHKTYQEELDQLDREYAQTDREIARRMKEVGDSGTGLGEIREMAEKMDSAVNALEWKNDLVEKRSYLIEKAITLYEKNKDLTKLYTELGEVSKSLKESNLNYSRTVNEYETKIQKLNSVWVQDKAKQQTEIDRLKAQIKNEKVKLMASKLDGAVVVPTEDGGSVKAQDEALKTSKETKESQIAKAEKPKKVIEPAPKPEIVKEKTDTGKTIKDTVEVNTDPQAEIKRLQAELAFKEQELVQRSKEFDVKIRELKSGWAKEKSAFTESVLENKFKSDFIPSQNDPLKDSDTYRNLMQELEYLRDQLSIREKQVNKIQNEILDHASQLEGFQKGISQRDTRLAEMDALIQVKDQQITALKKELAAKVLEVRQKDTEIAALKARNVSLEGLKDLNKKTVELKETAPVKMDSSVEKLKGLVSELQGSLGASSSSTREAEEVKQQLGEALKTLQDNDQEIRSLRKQIETDKKMADLKSAASEKKPDNAKIKDYQKTVEDLKERLSVAVAQRQEAEEELKKATQKLSQMVEEARKSKEKSEDKSNLKRLEELTRQLSEVTSQMDRQTAEFEKQIADLKGQLARKDSEIADLKNRLEFQQNQIGQFSSTVERATEKLKTTSMERGQKPTPAAISDQKVEIEKSEDMGDWDPADNDVYALQQRLNTISKQLRFTQEELAERTKEKDELNKKLEQQKFDAPVPLVEKDIVKLENELAAFRQQSDLTKATIRLQQESLQKSQKEVDRKERSLKSILDQSEKLRKQMESYRATLKEKDEQIGLQQKALDHEIRKNDKLTRKLREIQRTAMYDQGRNGGLKQPSADLNRELETYENRESDYKRQITDIKEQLKSSYVMIEEGEKRVAVLKKRLAIREERIAELQKEMDAIKAEYKKASGSSSEGQNK